MLRWMCWKSALRQWARARRSFALPSKEARTLTTKGTKVHEGKPEAVDPLCYFVPFVVMVSYRVVSHTANINFLFPDSELAILFMSEFVRLITVSECAGL